jgi:hypothetical protein
VIGLGANREAAVNSRTWGRLSGTLAASAVAACLTTAAALAQQGAIGTGGIKGFVHDSAGLGIVGVEILLAGSMTRFETDENGRFVLSKVPAGPLSLRFRRLGYRPDTVDLMVMAGQTLPLDVAIGRVALGLAPVVVRARETLTGWRVGFYDRRDQGAGHFLTKEDLEKRNPSMLTDMFRMIPGVQVRSVGSSMLRQVRFRGGRCAPLTWLDGAPLNAGEFDLDALSPRSIEAMEVYSGPASVPLQFQSSRNLATSCGAIIIWSREGELKPRQRKGAVSAAAQLAKLVDNRSVLTAAEVDVPAHQHPERPVRPQYPVSLFDAGIPGSVMAEFVVDPSGTVNMDTFSVVFASTQAFTEAVERALRDALYVPAQRKGYPVAQVVQHEFKFVPDSSQIRKK